MVADAEGVGLQILFLDDLEHGEAVVEQTEVERREESADPAGDPSQAS